MVVTENQLNNWMVFILKGQFIVRNIAHIRQYFERIEEMTPPEVAIDMGEVTLVDSSAITMLINFQRRIIQKDGRLVLFGMRPDIAEIFSILGIEKLFRICTTDDEFETRYLSENL